MSNYVTVQMAGWVKTLSDGVQTLYLSLAEEGITTAPTDTPANTQYQQAILDVSSFSIRRAPTAWYEGDSDGNEAASFSQLQIYNAKGTWSFLLRKNLENTGIVIQIPDARPLTTGTQMRDALTILTGVIGKITENEQRVITIPIRDTITRLDKALPVRFVPGFRDSGAAGQMVPLSYGGLRNRKGLLIDAANRIYLLHDEAIPNMLKVTDKGAPLDPKSSPPQFSPALNGAGVQLESDAVGEVRFDFSSYGSQSTIPGVEDILNGAGQFLGTWSGSPAVPPGWTWTNSAGSSIGKLTNPPYAYLGTGQGVSLHSTKVFDPSIGSYGDVFSHAVTLLAGATYRISFVLANVQTEAPYFIGGMQGGLMVATKLSKNPVDYITGYGTPLSAAAFSSQRLSFEFTMPKNGGGSSAINFLAVPSAGNAPNNAQGAVFLELADVIIELVGQFVDQPLTPMPFGDYVRKILVDHAGEDASIFNSDEAYSVFKRADGTLMPWGISFDAPPNIIHDCLAKPARSGGFVLITDALGSIRFRRQSDPRDPANQGTIKCDFSQFNMSRPVISDDVADALTTLFGARPNQNPYGSDADFVTDTAIITADTKARYERPSQFFVRSAYFPLPQFAGAVNAPIFDTVLDEKDDVAEEANRICGQFAARRYSNTDASTDKRLRATFTVTFDDPNELGITTKCAVPDLMYGDIVYIDYVEEDEAGNVLNSLQTYASVVVTNPYYFRNSIELVVRF